MQSTYPSKYQLQVQSTVKKKKSRYAKKQNMIHDQEKKKKTPKQTQ